MTNIKHLSLKKANIRRTCRIMRVFLLFFTLGISVCFSNNSYSQSTKLSLNLKNKTIKQVFTEIEKNSEFIFFYQDDIIDVNRRVTVNTDNGTIEQILGQILTVTDNTYFISDRSIYIIKKVPDNIVDEDIVQQQKRTIIGTITDKEGEAIIGANIVEKGTRNGTITDVGGRFSLNVENDAVLHISYIGYLAQEINTAGRTSFNIILQEGTQALEEVVVVGYGTQKKVNLTGSVATVSGERLENRPIASISQGLQGLIPNLNIIMQDGDPTTNADYNVRGYESITGGSPLVLVDGVPMNADNLNPNDIASVTVLKDAASSAVYGARAAFGVVLVETKQGKGKKANLTFSTEHSLAKPIWFYEPVTDPATHWEFYNQANLRTNGTVAIGQWYMDKLKAYKENPAGQNAYEVVNGQLYFYGNNDYHKKVLLDLQPQQKYNMNISKKDENGSYYVSFGYLNKDGYLKVGNEKYKRYNILMKGDVKIKSWLHLDDKIVFNAIHSDKMHNYGTDVSFNSITRLRPTTILEFPDLPYYMEEGDREQYEQYIGMPASGFLNLLGYLEKGGRTTFNNGDLYFTQGLTFTPLKGLKFRGEFTYNVYFKKYQDVAPKIDFVEINLTADPMTTNQLSANDYIQNTNNYNQSFVLNTYAEYEKKYKGIHYLKAMAGFNQEWSRYEWFSALANNLLVPNIWDLKATTGDQITNSNKQHVSLRGVFYRLNYIYKDRYLLEFDGRYDGTSRFPKHSRFGFFPSASLGWRISKEPFMTDAVNWLDNLKLRASYGELGNQALGSNYYPYIPTMTPGTGTYLMNGDRIPYVAPAGLVSSTLTWERVATRNIGLDFTILKQRLDVSLDAYIRDTKDMLMDVLYPDILGTSSPKENAADLRTKGWELSVNWHDKIGKDWKYGLTLALSDNQTEITKYENPTGALSEYYVGQKLGEIWGYVTEGIFQTDDEVTSHADQSLLGTNWLAGDIKYADLNDDGKINPGNNTLVDPGDRRIIGNSTLRYSFGISPSVSWKNWSLNVFFQGILKGDYLPPGTATWVAFYPLKSTYIDKYYLTECWSEDNRDAYFAAPHISQNNHKNTQPQSRYVQNAAYIRLKNLTLSYNFPSSLTKKVGISGASVYLAGMNLWEYSKMHKPLDPEQTDLSMRYPRQRIFSLGVKFTL